MPLPVPVEQTRPELRDSISGLQDSERAIIRESAKNALIIGTIAAGFLVAKVTGIISDYHS